MKLRNREGDLQQNKRFRIWAVSDVFNELFRILVKMRPLYKLAILLLRLMKGTTNALKLDCVT